LLKKSLKEYISRDAGWRRSPSDNDQRAWKHCNRAMR